MSEFMTIEPIKPKVETGELTPQQLTNLQFNFAAWRFHVWGKNLGSYEQIERKVAQGKLQMFTCPDAKCDCKYEKKRGSRIIK
jgi:hypothetical protein